MNGNLVKISTFACGALILAALWKLTASADVADMQTNTGTGTTLDAVSPRVATAPALSARVNVDSKADRPREQQALSRADREELLLKKLRRMDETFFEEQVSPAWAANASDQIDAALHADNLKALGASAPDSYRAECRSSSCKLSLAFSDALHADNTILALTTEIGTTFPEAVVVPAHASDGSAQYFVYMSSVKGSSLLGG